MPLAYHPSVQDLFWCSLDCPDAEARAELALYQILFGEPGQVLLALGIAISTSLSAKIFLPHDPSADSRPDVRIAEPGGKRIGGRP